MALTDADVTPAIELWDDGLWEELLAYVEAGIVVPIIGPASYPVEIEGRTVALDSYIAERLASKLALPAAVVSPGTTLNNVVSAYLRGGGRRERVYPTIQGIMQEARLTPPTVLKQLAGIRHFNLFVTTGFDALLETAIDEVRFSGEQRTRVITYAPNNKQDLPQGGDDGRPTVYHLFGKVSALPNSYAISDEDLLEFLYALQSDSRRPENLLGRLESENVLLIGANFPDWVARMFLRTTKGKRLSDSRQVLEILAEDHSARAPSLITFLTNFSPQTKIFSGGSVQFVEALWERWRERNGAAEESGEAPFVPPPEEMPPDAIFISYAREDIAAVRALRDGLDAAGLTVWFDFDRLGAGDSFDLKIQQNIRRCSLFIPVLSRNAESRAEGFFRREWRYALDRDLDIDPGRPFIIPVVVDGLTDFATLPRRFREINIMAAPDGQPSAEFITQLKQIGGRR
jgi:hypothetical protein